MKIILFFGIFSVDFKVTAFMAWIMIYESRTFLVFLELLHANHVIDDDVPNARRHDLQNFMVHLKTNGFE